MNRSKQTSHININVTDSYYSKWIDVSSFVSKKTLNLKEKKKIKEFDDSTVVDRLTNTKIRESVDEITHLPASKIEHIIHNVHTVITLPKCNTKTKFH